MLISSTQTFKIILHNLSNILTAVYCTKPLFQVQSILFSAMQYSKSLETFNWPQVTGNRIIKRFYEASLPPLWLLLGSAMLMDPHFYRVVV